MPRNKVHVYYTTQKPKDEPNRRVYYISRWHGAPFMRFDLPHEIEEEKKVVAVHLGLQLKHIEWHSHRGSKS